MSLIDNEGRSAAGTKVPKSSTLATDKLNPGGLDKDGLVKIEEKKHDGIDHSHDAASAAGIAAAKAGATKDHHLPTSDH